MTDSQFDKIISIDNLRKAWIKVHQYAKTDEIFYDEYAYTTYSEHLEARLQDLSRELRDGIYRPSYLRYTKIPKGAGERRIYFLTPKDSIVIQAVINVIGPDFEANFIKESFGNRLNINSHESKDAYENWQEKYSEYVSVVRGFTSIGLSGWYLITDIENYYPSISKEWLIGLFRAKIDNSTFRLVELFLNIEALGDDEKEEIVKGIPPGPIYSHFFANIYLDEFDHLAQKLTLGYARYVDDICFVCNSEEAIDNAKMALLNYLERWGQKFKEKDKTVKRSIVDIEPLLDHTRKMKYATRLDIVETYEESAEDVSTVGATEKPFFRLYKIADREGDLNRLVEEAGVVLSLLKRSGADDLADVIYSLLETHPVRPSTLKAALVYLLEIENNNPSEKFRQFFLEDSHIKVPYISTVFLRLLSSFKWSDNIARDIIYLYIKDAHYLVRGNAYIALKSIGVVLDVDSFSTLLSQEKSVYAKERLIDCYPCVNGTVEKLELTEYLNHEVLSIATIRSYIQLIEQEKIGRDLINTVWAIIKDHRLKLEFYMYLYFIAATQDFLWLAKELLVHDDDHHLVIIIRPVVLEVINKLTLNTEIIKLHQFAEHLKQLGFMKEALIGYFQVASSSPEIKFPEEINKAVEVIERETGSPEWINDPKSSRYLYRHEANDTDYLCQYIEFNKQNRGLLEIISLERIKSGGFDSYEVWGKYLTGLSDAKILPKIHLGKYSETQFSCFYEFPVEYLPLSEILSDETVIASLSQSNIFQLGQDLLESIKQSGTAKFTIHSLDPFSILWSPITGKHFFIGIGASLSAGKYYCSVPGCKNASSDSEIGIASTVLNFGLLMYQLLVKHCPIVDVFSTTSKYSSVKLFDLLKELDVLPHYKMILGRLLNSDPGKRYGKISDLASDFKQANHFRKIIEKSPDLRDDEKTLVILMDFVTFRLRIISRNPTMNSNSTLTSASRMIDELANVIQYLPNNMTNLWSVGLEDKARFVEFPADSKTRKLSPEGKRLLDIAYGWEKIHRFKTSHLDQLTALPRLFLYRVLAIESLATFVGILANLNEEQYSSFQSQLTKFSETLDALFIPDENEKEIILRTTFQDYPLTITKKDLLDLQRMPRWIKSKGNLSEFIPTLRILGIFLVIISYQVKVIVDSDSKLTTSPILKNKVDDVSKLIWVLLKSLPSLDDQIRNFHSICSDDAQDHNLVESDVWLRFVDFLEFISILNPAKRKSAQVYSYQVKNYRNEADGLLEFISFRKHSLPFDTKETFISGNPALIDPDILRPVLVDVIKLENHSTKPSSVFAPLGKFTELPFKKRRIALFDIVKFANKSKDVYKAAQYLCSALIGIAIWFLAESINQTISGSPQPVISATSAIVSAIFTGIFTENAKKFINMVNPEDNDLLIRDKRNHNIKG